MVAVTLVTSGSLINANAMTKKDIKYSPIMKERELKDEINWLKDEILENIKHKRGEFFVDFNGYRHVPGNDKHDGKLHFTAYNLTNKDLKLYAPKLTFNNITIPRTAYTANWSHIRSNSAKEFTITLKRGAVRRYFRKNYNKVKLIGVSFKHEDWFNKNEKLSDYFSEEYANDIMDYDEYRVFKGASKKVRHKLQYEFDHYVIDKG